MTILSPEKIKVNVEVRDKYEAIRMVGQLLVDAGHVPAEYIEAMIQRENMHSTYMGAGLAIPHGTNEARGLVRSTGLAVLTVPKGVSFEEGKTARLIVGIAAIGDEHMDLLTNIAMVVSDEKKAARLIQTDSADEVLSIFREGAGI